MTPNLQQRQRGFTVTEMMVAALIGLFLLAGAVSMLVSTRRTYNVQTDLSRIQENARFTMDMMQRDIRMAGYFGCHNSLNNVQNQLNGATGGKLYDSTSPLEGLEQGAAGWAPSNNTADAVVANRGGTNEGDSVAQNDATLIAGSDAITIRRLSGTSWAVTADMAGPGDDVQILHNITDGVSLQAGDIVAVSDCSATDIVALTQVPAVGATGGLKHAVGAGDKGNSVATLSKRYDKTARVSPVVFVRYYVGRTTLDGSVEPALFRQTLNQGDLLTQKLIDGVESMQITYGVDTNGDKIPDTYVPANDGQLGNSTTNWDRVAAVRVALLLRSPTAVDVDIDENTYTVNGQEMFGGASPDDRRRRRVIMTTIFVRNDTR
ncbi:MAG: PilW family protein [Gammaproteobacteria bacterium]